MGFIFWLCVNYRGFIDKSNTDKYRNLKTFKYHGLHLSIRNILKQALFLAKWIAYNYKKKKKED